MDKLLKLVEKLRGEIVPEQPLSKMAKDDILRFISESSLLLKMRAFHQSSKGIRSAITDDESDGPLVPSETDLAKWRVGKLRKLVRNFHRATGILKKYAKFTASRLRSHIKRHRYEEMLYGDEDIASDEEPEPRKKKSPKKKKEKVHTKQVHTMPSIIINTGDHAPCPVKEEKDCCCPEENKLKDQDFFGLVQKLAPNLYKTLVEKSFLLDMCALDRKRMESNVCPPDCRRKAWDEFACCEPDGVPAWFLKWQGGQACAPVAAPVSQRVSQPSTQPVSQPVSQPQARMVAAPVPSRTTLPGRQIQSPIRSPRKRQGHVLPPQARTQQQARVPPGQESMCRVPAERILIYNN